MKGKKTTLTDASRKIYEILLKNNINKVACGIIIQVKGRKDHKISIKIKQENGCTNLSVTGKYYKQELRIYDEEIEKISQLLKKENDENLRILE